MTKQRRQQSKKGYPVKNNGSKDSNSDWIAALAKNSCASSSSTSIPIRPKAERIQKRNAKKQERLHRRQEKYKHKDNNENKRSIQRQQSKKRAAEDRNALRNVTQLMDLIVERIHGGKPVNTSQLYVCPQSLKKGKATTGNKMTDKLLQPRKRDYGGLGLARPSLYLPLRDASFVPKLEQEFAEHVDGFFGKQRTKAMKKQMDGNMLWRRLVDQKKSGGTGVASGHVGGKKLSDMSPDERVEAMIATRII